MLALAQAIAANQTPRGVLMFRFHRVAARISARFGTEAANSWIRAVTRFQGTINEKLLRSALVAKDLAGIDAAIKSSGFGRIMRDLEKPLLRTAAAAGTASAQTLTKAGFKFQFNAVHPNVVLFARDQVATLVVGVTQDVKVAIRTVIALGAQQGLTIQQQARAIRSVVGLPPPWSGAPLRLGAAIRRGDVVGATARRLSAVDKQQIRSRIAKGTVTEPFISSIQERYAQSLINRRALNIARTETLRAANFGQHESWIQASNQGVLPADSRRFWIVTPDDRLSEEHAQIPGVNPDGRGLEELFETPDGPFMFPPSRPNCLLPGTLMQGRFVAGLKVQYAGEVLKLWTVGGRQLSVTANHPILTSRGFLPARLLRKGDQLLCYCDGVEVQADGVLFCETNEYNPPTAVEEIFDAMVRRAPSSVAQSTDKDLHGDARFCQSDINIVRTDLGLLLDGYIAPPQTIGKSIFILPPMQQAAHTCLGALDLGFQAIGCPPPSNMGGLSLPLGDCGVLLLEPLPFDEFCFGPAAHLHTSLLEPIVDYSSITMEACAQRLGRFSSQIPFSNFFDGQALPPAVNLSNVLLWARGQSELDTSGPEDPQTDPQLACYLLERYAGLVELDKLVAVDRYFWRGHVYDLESMVGWNIANNIVISNCRCGIGLGVGTGGTPGQAPADASLPPPLLGRDLSTDLPTYISLSSKESTAVAKQAGVKLTTRGTSATLRQRQTSAIMAQGAKDVQALGFDLSKLNLRMKGSSKITDSVFNPKPTGKGVEITLRNRSGAEWAELQSRNKIGNPPWSASDDLAGAAHHEIGHALHHNAVGGAEWERLAVWDTAKAPEFVTQVSRFAVRSPREFVGDVFSGLTFGKQYPANVLRLYEKLKGPVAPSWRKTFNDILGGKKVVVKPPSAVAPPAPPPGAIPLRVSQGPIQTHISNPVRSPTEIQEAFKKLGIRTPKARRVLPLEEKQIVEMMLQGAKDIEALGFDLSGLRMVARKRLGQASWTGSYSPAARVVQVRIQPLSLTERNLVRAFKEKWHPSDSWMSTVHHELGHAIHHKDAQPF